MITAAVARAATDDDDVPMPHIRRLASVEPEAITWLWPGRLAAGKLALLVGDPGLGKSWITLDAAARISTGRTWPDGAACPVGDVLLLSAEDGLVDTIRPRLDECGADVDRVHALTGVLIGDRERGVQIADIGILERAIALTGATLTVIDPLSAYLGGTDSHKEADVRGLLAPLAQLAERTGVAILGVMHLSKSTQRSALHRTIGSIAFVGAARIVIAVAAHPDDDRRRILCPVKQNICAPAPALGYSLADGRLTWEDAPVEGMDIDALLAGPAQPRDRAEQTEAESVIAELLEDEQAWPLPAKEAFERGEQYGIPKRTLRWTAAKLGIRIKKAGFKTGWVWYRPEAATSPERESIAPSIDVAPSANGVWFPSAVETPKGQSTRRGNDDLSYRFVDEDGDGRL